jgi:hypothetical protein
LEAGAIAGGRRSGVDRLSRLRGLYGFCGDLAGASWSGRCGAHDECHGSGVLVGHRLLDSTEIRRSTFGAGDRRDKRLKTSHRGAVSRAAEKLVEGRLGEETGLDRHCRRRPCGWQLDAGSPDR